MFNESFFDNRENKGNSLKIHNFIKSSRFFKLLTQIKEDCPEWSQKKKLCGKVNLKKSFQSFGGNQVKKTRKNSQIKKNEYYQKLIEGEHLSVQFFSDKNKAKILCVCNQIFSKRREQPFIIKGLITKNIEYSLMKNLSKICCKLTKALKLNGVCNIDIIEEAITKRIFIIELNARPGLSTNILWRISNNLFEKKLILKKTFYKNFFATQIVYSLKSISIENENLKYLKKLKGKEYISELPSIGQKIKKNDPICLIHLTSKKIEKLRENLEKMSYKILSNLN